MARYRVLGGPNGTIGVDYGDKRAEPGEEIDIPDAHNVRHLLDDGVLAVVETTRVRPAAPTPKGS